LGLTLRIGQEAAGELAALVGGLVSLSLQPLNEVSQIFLVAGRVLHRPQA